MLDLRNVFAKKNDVLRNLLSEYNYLKLIGSNQANGNRPYYISTIGSGWHYTQTKNAETGEVVETIKIVTTETEEIMNSIMVELGNNEGFLRFKIKAKRPPLPPSFEWILEVNPQPQDKRTI